MSRIVSGSRPLLELTDITVSFDGFLALRDLNPVSYTHLTLPTNREV